MDHTLRNIILSLLGVLVFFALIIWVGGALNPSLQLDESG